MLPPLARLDRAGGDRDIEPGSGQPDRNGFSDAATGTGDEGDLTALHGYRPTFPKTRAIGASPMGRGAIQAPTITTSDTTKMKKPIQLIASCDAYMWLRLRSAPVAKTSVT